MDWTESQLRYGSALNKAAEPRKERSRSSRDSSQGEKRKKDKSSNSLDFLTYALSLMRQANNEHSDLLPSLDVSSLRHVAYLLDAFISLLKIERDRSLIGAATSKPEVATSPQEGW